MFCPGCGKEVDENANVCPFCGAQLKAAPAAPAAAAASNTGLIGLIVGALGAVIGLIAVFLPIMQAELLGFKESASYIGNESTRVFGIISLVLLAVSLLFVLLRLKVPAIIFSTLNLVYTVLICVVTVIAMNDDGYGLVKPAIGFYLLIVGAVVLFVGSILTKKNK